MGRVPNRRSVRVGGLSDKGSGKALAGGPVLLTDVNKPVRVELENGANGKADAHAGRGHGAASVLEPLILA